MGQLKQLELAVNATLVSAAAWAWPVNLDAWPTLEGVGHAEVCMKAAESCMATMEGIGMDELAGPARRRHVALAGAACIAAAHGQWDEVQHTAGKLLELQTTGMMHAVDAAALWWVVATQRGQHDGTASQLREVRQYDTAGRSTDEDA